MGDKIKSAGSLALGFAVILALLVFAAVLLNGMVLASEKLLPFLFNAGWFTLALVVLILLPLSIFSGLRHFTGGGIFFASYLFGLICWLTGVWVAYTLWGTWAIVIGFLFLGGGVVPIGMLASIFHGQWETLGVLTALLVVTFGSRLVGLYIAENGR